MEAYIAISTVFATRNGPSPFIRNLPQSCSVDILPDICTTWFWWKCNGWHRIRVSGDKLSFPFVPRSKQFCRWCRPSVRTLSNVRSGALRDSTCIYIRPGCDTPANLTPGMCREVAYTPYTRVELVRKYMGSTKPLKSQIALHARLLNSRAIQVRGISFEHEQRAKDTNQIDHLRYQARKYPY